jgi:hypothetical protein
MVHFYTCRSVTKLFTGRYNCAPSVVNPQLPYYISFSMALPAHSGPWPLIQSRNHFSQTVGLLRRVISPSQGHYLHAGQHKYRINANTDIHALSGIRTHDSSVWASEDSSCLRPRCYRDRYSKMSYCSPAKRIYMLYYIELNIEYLPKQH